MEQARNTGHIILGKPVTVMSETITRIRDEVQTTIKHNKQDKPQ